MGLWPMGLLWVGEPVVLCCDSLHGRVVLATYDLSHQHETLAGAGEPARGEHIRASRC